MQGKFYHAVCLQFFNFFFFFVGGVANGSQFMLEEMINL